MNLIRRLIGRLTKPENVYEYHGDFYIPVSGIPDWVRPERDWPGLKLSYRNEFQYQKISQNFWGVWSKEFSWLGLNQPIKGGDK